jgi:hypothetical protein
MGAGGKVLEPRVQEPQESLQFHSLEIGECLTGCSRKSLRSAELWGK